jgi:hypothetical protein
MDIGERGGAGCGTEERVIPPDSGRDMREGIGESVKDHTRIGKREVIQIRRSSVC